MFAEQFGQVGQQAAEHLGGHLLDAKLQQQRCTPVARRGAGNGSGQFVRK